jgi:hypothetical protein
LPILRSRNRWLSRILDPVVLQWGWTSCLAVNILIDEEWACENVRSEDAYVRKEEVRGNDLLGWKVRKTNCSLGTYTRYLSWKLEEWATILNYNSKLYDWKIHLRLGCVIFFQSRVFLRTHSPLKGFAA